MKLPTPFDPTASVSMTFSYKAGADSVGVVHTVTLDDLVPPTGASEDYFFYTFPFIPPDTNWNRIPIFLPG